MVPAELLRTKQGIRLRRVAARWLMAHRRLRRFVLVLVVISSPALAVKAWAGSNLFMPFASGGCAHFSQAARNWVSGQMGWGVDLDAAVQQSFPFLGACSDQRLATCLAAEAHAGADGLYSLVKCMNREMKFVFASSPLRQLRLSEAQAQSALLQQSGFSSDSILSCLARVWVFDRQPWGTAKRACTINR